MLSAGFRHGCLRALSTGTSPLCYETGGGEFLPRGKRFITEKQQTAGRDVRGLGSSGLLSRTRKGIFLLRVGFRKSFDLFSNQHCCRLASAFLCVVPAPPVHQCWYLSEPSVRSSEVLSQQKRRKEWESIFSQLTALNQPTKELAEQ